MQNNFRKFRIPVPDSGVRFPGFRVAHTRDNMGVQGYTRAYSILQGYTRVYRGLQGYTMDYRGLKGYTRD